MFGLINSKYFSKAFLAIMLSSIGIERTTIFFSEMCTLKSFEVPRWVPELSNPIFLTKEIPGYRVNLPFKKAEAYQRIAQESIFPLIWFYNIFMYLIEELKSNSFSKFLFFISCKSLFASNSKNAHPRFQVAHPQQSAPFKKNVSGKGSFTG